jgi:hypothetical protein
MQYLCGHDPDCFVEPEQLTDQATRDQLLERVRTQAERNLQQYALVGVLEGLHKFLAALDAMFPGVYGGASALYPTLKAQQQAKAKSYPTPTRATLALVEAYYQQEVCVSQRGPSGVS